MDTELGIYWKSKIEKLYEELDKMEVVFFSPEDEAKLEQQFKEVKLEEREARREFRRKLYGWSAKLETKKEERGDAEANDTETAKHKGSLDYDYHEPRLAHA